MATATQILGTLPVVNSSLAVVAVNGRELAKVTDLARIVPAGRELAVVTL